MKTLYLIRHAKSDRPFETLSDFDRPLSTKGYTDAHKMSLELKSKKTVVNGIVSSPAIRAISTALIFARNFNFNHSMFSIEPGLYHSDAEHYLDVISETDNKINTLLLFAHNPTITECANILIKNSMVTMPTCGIIGITNNTNDWKTFNNSDCRLILFDFPKNYI